MVYTCYLTEKKEEDDDDDVMVRALKEHPDLWNYITSEEGSKTLELFEDDVARAPIHSLCCVEAFSEIIQRAKDHMLTKIENRTLRDVEHDLDDIYMRIPQQERESVHQILQAMGGDIPGTDLAAKFLLILLTNNNKERSDSKFF